MKEYRRRFMQVSMLLIGIVLTAIFMILFCYIRLGTYDYLALTMREMLEPLSNQDPSILPENAEKSQFITVFVGETGTEDLIVFDLSAEYNEDTLYDVVESILMQEESFGTLLEQEIIYYRREMSSGYKIAMVDTAYMTASLSRFVLLLAVIWICAMLLFFCISLHFSNLAIQPLIQAQLREKQFIADASHDLKTPLSVIIASNEILLHAENESVQNCLKWIHNSQESALNMQSMLLQMMDLCVADASAASQPPVVCNLSEIVRKVLLQMEAVAWEKTVELSCDIQDDLLIVGIPEILLRILSILLDNALKYELSGGTVFVRAYIQHLSVCVCVHNHAVISEQDLPHIFDRYYRANQVRNGDGHGLGLSIAMSLTKKMHGALSCKSTISEGTTFVIRFKRCLRFSKAVYQRKLT